MKEYEKLSAQTRNDIGNKIQTGRNSGLVPCVAYGHESKTHHLWVKSLEFEKVFSKSGGSALVDLVIDDSSQPKKILIHDVQYSPVSGKAIHADFFEVRMNEKIESEVPLEFIGESPAVKALGGVLIKNTMLFPVTCFPMDLPHTISVDISLLKTFDDVICVKNVPLGDKVETTLDPEAIVALVTPPRSEEELQQLQENPTGVSTDQQPERIAKKPAEEIAD